MGQAAGRFDGTAASRYGFQDPHQKTLAELGQYNTWDRNIPAELVELLNADPDMAPAVLTFDILYMNDLTKDGDARFAKACKDAKNVITANNLVYEKTTKQDANGDYYVDELHIRMVEKPYEALNAVTRTGFANTTQDKDGYIRQALAYEDAEKTNRFAKKLSGVYRYLLTTHDRPQVSVGEELDFVDAYLYLERIRFGDALRVAIVDCEIWHERKIVPVSVQMLVENALKHNIATSEMPLTIHIIIDSDGIVVTNNLQRRSCVVRNGMGLRNLQHQYALYNRRIEIESSDTSFIVKIPYLN